MFDLSVSDEEVTAYEASDEYFKLPDWCGLSYATVTRMSGQSRYMQQKEYRAACAQARVDHERKILARV